MTSLSGRNAFMLLLLLTIGTIAIQLQAVANLPVTELSALHDLYNSTHGDDWLWRPIGQHWVFTGNANPCTGQWQGITCILPVPHTMYYVSEISLPGYHLVGTIPESISAFGHLTLFDIAYNYVNGSIPSSIDQLSNLNTLTLTGNPLTGGMPTSLCELTNLAAFYAVDTQIGGTIPFCLGQLSLLQNVTLSHSRLTGSIPPSLGNWTNLRTLALNSNSLIGTIPDSLAAIPTLQSLGISDNMLTGTIPRGMFAMTDLWDLQLSENSLNGTLPEFTSAAAKLNTLILQYNRLTGTVPASIGNLSGITTLQLNDNLFTGTLPQSLGELQALSSLYLDVNHFSGPIPPTLCALRGAAKINLGKNALTGTLPYGIGNLTNLVEIITEFNLLSGQIPASLGTLTNMVSLDLASNLLTGSIPSALGDLTALTAVSLAENLLTGSIPATVGHLRLLTTLDVSDNILSGSLPGSIANMTSCQYLYLPGNMLSGSLPESVGTMSQLTELEATDNILSGPLPTSMSTLRHLNLLILTSNRLSGRISSVFNASRQLFLELVSLQDNQLTGTLPAEVFRLPALQTFVALSNCFHGTIPEEICNATALNSLVLDGLSSATSCRRTLPSGAYLLSRSVGGTVPQCLFALPSLITLHLSGNSFTGSLSSLEAVSPSILDLSVSHNLLTGTIPAVFQERRWSNFDASYNRLTGILRADFCSGEAMANESTVSLENNRLSGRIPGALQTMQNVSVLGTNLFECNLAGSDLPQHDSGRGNYQCGSTGFNIPYYVWLCLVVSMTMIVLWWWHRPLSASSHLIMLTRLVTSWYASSQRVIDGRPLLASLMHALEALCVTSAYCAVYVTVVLLPCYLLLSRYCGTLTHQYAWSASAAFLSGAVPVAVELPLWVLLMCIVLCTVLSAVRKAEHFTQPGRTVSTAGKGLLEVSAELRGRFLIRTLFVLIDLGVVVGVNVLYVYIAIYQSSALLVLAQVLMSFFKLLWSSTCLDTILRWLAGKFTPELVAGDGYAKAYRTEFLSLHLFVSLVNSIVIPCLVVASISPNCFYNVFQPAPVVQSYFSYRYCSGFNTNGKCVATTILWENAAYNSPYTYNYQCSSSLITYYAPAYVNLCILAAFASPLSNVFCAYLLRRASPGTFVHAVLEYNVPRLLQDFVPPGAGDGKIHTFMNAYRLLITLVTYLGVLLTFGAMLPPLGVALAVTVAMVVLFSKIKIGRFLCASEEQGHLDKFVRILEQQCEGAGSVSFLQSALWMLLTLSCLFYTLFLFDTLGDAVGFRGALWVLVVVPLMPLCMFVYCAAWERSHVEKVHQGVGNQLVEGTVELSEVSAEVRSITDVETRNILFAVSRND